MQFVNTLHSYRKGGPKIRRGGRNFVLGGHLPQVSRPCLTLQVTDNTVQWAAWEQNYEIAILGELSFHYLSPWPHLRGIRKEIKRSLPWQLPPSFVHSLDATAWFSDTGQGSKPGQLHSTGVKLDNKRTVSSLLLSLPKHKIVLYSGQSD